MGMCPSLRYDVNLGALNERHAPNAPCITKCQMPWANTNATKDRLKVLGKAEEQHIQKQMRKNVVG